jgi:hypothetical protein
MKKNEKDIQYKILKSEACGHSIEYRMIKKETELEKAKIDEGLSAKEKKKARKERNEEFVPHEKEKFHSEGYREYKVPQSQEKLKQKLKSKERPKLPSKEDLEYPMAASEEMEKCIDNPDCGCQEKKKEIKKSSNFYIQKIQELRKAGEYRQPSLPGMETTGEKIGNFARNAASKAGDFASNAASKAGDFARNAASKAGDFYRGAGNQMSLPGMETTGEKIGNFARNAASKTLPEIGETAGAIGRKALPMAGRAVGGLARFATNPYAVAATEAVNPSQIGSGKNDPEEKFINNQLERPSRGGKNAGQYVYQNAPEGSQRAIQDKTNEMLGFKSSSNPMQQAPAAANPAAAPAAANPAAAPNAAGTSDAAASKPQSFAQAFNNARNARIAGTGPDTFPWNGKTYHSFQKDDFAQGQGAKYNPAAKAGTTAPNAAAPAATAAPASKPTMFSNSANASVLDTEPGKEMMSNVSNKLSGQPASLKTVPAKQAPSNFDNEYYDAQNEAPAKQINPSIQQGMAGSPSIPSSSKGMDLNRTNLRPPETNLKTPKGPA